MEEIIDTALLQLTDVWWEYQGYDITVEPFRKVESDLVIYRDYYKDESGRIAGYIITRMSDLIFRYHVETVGQALGVSERSFILRPKDAPETVYSKVLHELYQSLKSKVLPNLPSG